MIKNNTNCSSNSMLIPIIGIFGGIVIFKHNMTRRKIQKNLQRMNTYQSQGYIIANESQIRNQYNTIPVNVPVDYRGKELIRTYTEQLTRALGPEIRLARKNISTLRIQQDRKILSTGAVGIYDATNNIIKYTEEKASILGHETLHMASYMYEPSTDTHLTGFAQQKGNAKIGVGLNEGYTELLTARMFNHGKVTSYKRLVRIVKLIEKFFPSMGDLSHNYFTCNLPAVIRTLQNYCSRAEIMEIIFGLDKLYEYEYLPGSPVAIIEETKLATKLYDIYERNFGTDAVKMANFKSQVNENKLTGMIISGRRMRVTRTTPFTTIKNGIQTSFRKIKSFFTTAPKPRPVTSPSIAYSR